MAASWQESEIIDGLFVGDMQDAQKFDGTIITVLPDLPQGEPPQAIHMPFLAEGVVSLDRTASLIEAELADGHRVLVHCEEGCERAPLVVAWFLKVKRGHTLDQAYALLKSRRPIVVDRRRWLGIHNR
jgi:protein-tyrosine phosphatase